MAHSKSAQKRIRQSSAGRLRNRRRKAAVKEAIHQFDAAVLLALLVVNVAGYLAGYGGGRLLRLPDPMRRALTLEVGM